MTDIPITSELSGHDRLVKEIGLIRLELVGLEERFYLLQDAFYQHTHAKGADRPKSRIVATGNTGRYDEFGLPEVEKP